MKNFIILIIFSMCCVQLSAQYFTISDQMVYGGIAEDYPVDMLEADDGGYFLLLRSASEQTGNKTAIKHSGSGVGTDYWLVKTDSLFLNEWQLSYGGDDTAIYNVNKPIRLGKDNFGNIYLFGYSNIGVFGNKTVPNFGGLDFWYIKIDQNGNEIDQKAYGGSSNDFMNDALIVNDKIFMTGRSVSDSSGVKTGFQRGSADYWLICTDTAGNILWEKTYGGEDRDDPRSISYHEENKIIYLIGKSQSDSSYEKSEDVFGGIQDLWLLKINALNGDLITDKTIGSDGFEQIRNKCMVLSNNNLYVAGSTDGGISGHKTEISRGGGDVWMLKLDTSLNIIWDKTIGGTSGDDLRSILINNGNIYLGCNSNSNIGYEKTENSINNSSDNWIVKVDTSGQIVWDKTIGSYAYDFDVSLLFDDSVMIVYSIIRHASISGDLNQSPYGYDDAWIYRLDIPLAKNQKITGGKELTIYPNPAQDNIYFNRNLIGNLEIKIYTSTGKLVKSSKINHNKLNISDLNEGSYLVEIISENKIFTKKIVIN